MIDIFAGETHLPSPVEMTTGDEIIWSADTGRTAAGKMVGDVIAAKRQLAITWGVLTTAELETIRSSLVTGFFPVSVWIDRVNYVIQAYRGTLTYELLGSFGGETYYRSANVSLIQQ